MIRFVKRLIILIRLRVFQFSTSCVPFQKVVHANKELDMIRREGFKHYGDVLPRSRGYLGRDYHSQSSRPIHAAIPASKVC